MEIVLAKNIGFCPGVKRAVKIAQGGIRNNNRPIFMFGSLVHNEEVSKAFKKQGVYEVHSLEEVPVGSVLIISAHGVGPILKNKILKKKIKIIDTTCPWVKRTHRFVKKISQKEYKIILLGEKKHREIEGIKEWGGGVHVVSTLGEAKVSLGRLRGEKIAFVSQTTQSKKLFDDTADFLKKKFPKTVIFDTICRVTLSRQRETRRLAKECDIIVVIGSKKSANSRRLFEISEKINKKTYFISDLKEIKTFWFKNAKKVGIASGASTPPEFVQKVKRKIESYD